MTSVNSECFIYLKKVRDISIVHTQYIIHQKIKSDTGTQSIQKKTKKTPKMAHHRILIWDKNFNKLANIVTTSNLYARAVLCVGGQKNRSELEKETLTDPLPHSSLVFHNSTKNTDVLR